jgi:hypothetical protein
LNSYLWAQIEMKQLFSRLPSPAALFDTHAKMVFFEAMWLTLALLIMLTSAHQPESTVQTLGLIAGACFAILMAISSYSSFVQWHRPQPPFDNSHFEQAVQYLIDLGLPEPLSRAMVKQEWEEEKNFSPQLIIIQDKQVLYQQARRKAFHALYACLMASLLIDACYWITKAAAAIWLSVGVAFLCCIILQASSGPAPAWRWLFLLIFVVGSALLTGHILYVAG